MLKFWGGAVPILAGLAIASRDGNRLEPIAYRGEGYFWLEG